MCTLSVITRPDGFLIGMNRDEKLNRGLASPPSRVTAGSTSAVYPLDSRGGTWVAVNSHRMAFALLNRNHSDPPDPARLQDRSRGFVITELIHSQTLQEVESSLGRLSLGDLPPFCLVGVGTKEKQIREWNWDQAQLSTSSHPWMPRHWFSSGLSDQKAEAQRSKVCQSAWVEADAGSAPWLRRLHGSHANGPGPFSICVHREDVQTLSYTELACDEKSVRLTYSPVNPCSRIESSSEYAQIIPAA